MAENVSREYTEEEVRKQFLEYVWMMIKYWEKHPDQKSVRERLEGLAFSVLTAIDGSAMDLPGFILAPMPHESDKDYAIENGENYYPQNDRGAIKCDIGGTLHDMFHRYQPE